MSAQNSVMASVTYGGQGAGFAKLQGENFSYCMVNYSIILGRNTENSKVDLDVSNFGGRVQKVSRCHVHIFYDFEHRHFALEVLGRNGCMIQGVSYLPGCDPVKLNSQDLIEIAGAKIYFLLPTRSIYATISAQRTTPLQAQHSSVMPPDHLGQGKLKRQNKKSSGGGGSNISKSYAINADSTGAPDNSEHNTDNQQLLPEEEKDVVSSIVTLISDICEPGEWVPMMKIYSELLVRFGEIWSQDNVRRYLTPEEGCSTETNGRPWSKLLPLLKKHPELFVMNTTAIGEATSEYVALA